MAEEGKIKALVVDDEAVIRDFLSRFLSLNGIEVTAAADGVKAVELTGKEEFDITFLDVRMPKMDGLETLRALKKIRPQGNYVMMTGYAVDDLLEKAEKEGAVSSLKKPFDISRIEATIKDYTQKKSAINILVIDDEQVILDYFKRLLKDDLYNVTTAKTDSEALAIIKQKDFDLVFLDIILGDIDGIGLYLKIRKERPNLNVILITGYPDKVKEASDLLIDIKGCLFKPLEIDKIFTELDKVRKSKKL